MAIWFEMTSITYYLLILNLLTIAILIYDLKIGRIFAVVKKDGKIDFVCWQKSAIKDMQNNITRLSSSLNKLVQMYSGNNYFCKPLFIKRFCSKMRNWTKFEKIHWLSLILQFFCASQSFCNYNLMNF